MCQIICVYEHSYLIHLFVFVEKRTKIGVLSHLFLAFFSLFLSQKQIKKEIK